MPIPASMVPDVRDGLKRYLAAGDGDLVAGILTMHIANGGTCDLPGPERHYADPHKIFSAYQARLRSMVNTAELYHVSAEMTDVCASAGLTMPGYKLHQEDMPADCGLIVFDKPIGTATHEDIAKEPQNDADRLYLTMAEAQGRQLFTVEAIAAMWRYPVLTFDGQPGVLVTTWTSNYDMAAYYESQGGEQGRAMGEMLRGLGYLTYHDEVVLPFGDQFDPELVNEEDKKKPIRNDALRTLIATWLIMGQPIVSTDPEPLPRQIRRRIMRETGKEPPAVHVVKLREARRPRPEPEEVDADGKRRYDRYRWVVHGHWRQQWYPSRNDHRPIYIPDHIKGPEHAPFKDVQRVFDLRR